MDLPEDGFYLVTREGLERGVEVRDGLIIFRLGDSIATAEIDEKFTDWKLIHGPDQN